MDARFTFYISVLAPIALGACAAQPDPISRVAEPAVVYANADESTVDEVRAAASELDLTDAQEADGVVCRREQKTGTHMRRVICRTEAQRAAMRENSQEWLRSGGIEGGPVLAR